MLFGRLPVDGGHVLRQLSWWKTDRLLGVVSCDQSCDRVVEFSVGEVDPEKHEVNIVQWYHHPPLSSLSPLIPHPSPSSLLSDGG